MEAFTLHLKKDEEPHSHSRSRQASNDASLQKVVLLVEDDRMLREMMAIDLQEAGLTVAMASDGDEALELMQAVRPDLILLDILMPRKDGFAVLEQMRSRKQQTPVVMLSNLGTPDQERQCRELGAIDFIVKSDLDTGDLWKRIQNYLK